MEGKKIYEESKEELVRITKNLSADSFTINASKLDGQTKEQLLIAIRKVITERSKDIDQVILGVQ